MKKLISLFAAITLIASAVADHHHEASHEGQSLFHGTFISNLDQANGKIISLAETFTKEQYAWRPAEGVRSVRETILHTAGANYFLATRLGVEMPEGMNPWGFEKSIETKEEAISTLKASIEFVKNAINHTSEEDLGTMVDLFGNEAPKMSAILIVGAHANEHLGQLIAYARSNGVTPPWSK